jgi:hypothetical protein
MGKQQLARQTIALLPNYYFLSSSPYRRLRRSKERKEIRIGNIGIVLDERAIENIDAVVAVLFSAERWSCEAK